MGDLQMDGRVQTERKDTISRMEALASLSGDTSFDILMDIIYDINEEKGWHSESRTFGEEVALFHSEFSEALEAFREGHEVTEVWVEQDKNGNLKPEGVPIELADAIIRLMDFCEGYNIDLWGALLAKVKYNSTRSYRHGGKKL